MSKFLLSFVVALSLVMSVFSKAGLLNVPTPKAGSMNFLIASGYAAGSNCMSAPLMQYFTPLDMCMASAGPHSTAGGGNEDYAMIMEHNGMVLDVYFGSLGATGCDGPFSGEVEAPTDTCASPTAFGDMKLTTGPMVPPSNFYGVMYTHYSDSTKCQNGDSTGLVTMGALRLNQTTHCFDDLMFPGSKMITCSGDYISIDYYSASGCPGGAGSGDTWTSGNVTKASTLASTCMVPGNTPFSAIMSAGFSVDCVDTTRPVSKKVKKSKPALSGLRV